MEQIADRAGRARGIWLILAFAAVSLVTALIATRFGGFGGPWLWNLDTPVDFPREAFLHDALINGRLPLWNDQLGLGYPFYAEGSMAAFYPPHWLIFQLPTVTALDVTRVFHLVLLGVGTGLLALRLSGSRAGALLAAGAVTLSGGLVPKLEWTNFAEAYAWLPWLLLPLVRRPHPSRNGLIGAGLALGAMALLAHPNVLAYSALAALVVMLVIAPSIRTIGRFAVVALIGVGIGAIQLVPMALLLTLSARSGGIGTDDLFAYGATPFDPLFFAFANVFVPANSTGWNIAATWYPNIYWGLLEGGGYVGLPILALAAIGLTTRRARPLLILIPVLVAIPILADFKPDLWAQTPILDGLRRPTRVYAFVDFALIIGAAIGVGRLARGNVPWRRVLAVVGIPVAGYAALLFAVNVVPTAFANFMDGNWYVPIGGGAQELVNAQAALNQVFPFVPELLLGVAGLGLIALASRERWVLVAIGAICLIPLAALTPSINSAQTIDQFDYGSSAYLQTLAKLNPNRELAFAQNIFFPGLPNQPQMAGVADIRMHSSLDLSASDDLLDQLVANGPNNLQLAKAVGIDTVITYGTAPCPGQPVAVIPQVHAGQDAHICHEPDAQTVPYWIPARDVDLGPATASTLPFKPQDALIQVADVAASAKPVQLLDWTDSSAAMVIDAPAAGWVYIDRAWWPDWQNQVDGQNVETYRALAGQLIFVLPGEHVIEQRYVPDDVLLGLGITLATLVVTVLILTGELAIWIEFVRRRTWGRRAAVVAGGAAGADGESGASGPGPSGDGPDTGTESGSDSAPPD